MNYKSVLTVLTVLHCLVSYSQELKTTKFGKGILNIVGQDSTWSMKVGARVQLLATSTWEDNRSPQSNMLVRRARLKFDGFALSPKLKYKIELGLSNRDMSGASYYTSNAPRYIYDAVLKWNFYKNFELWFGQTKLPGNRERVISSGNLQLVDRSLVNKWFNIDRDIGFQLKHHFKLSNGFLIREALSVSQGEGRNITTGNIGGHQYTARLELLPLGAFTNKGDYTGADLARESNLKIALGATFDYNHNAVKTRSNQGDYMLTNTDSPFETNISTIFIDAMLKYNGFSLMAEYAHRDADDYIAKNPDGTTTGETVQVGQGVNVQAGYVLKSNWEFSGRFTNIALDETYLNKLNQNQYTIGVSKYIAGHKLKAQSDISYLNNTNNNNEIMFRLQFELHF